MIKMAVLIGRGGRLRAILDYVKGNLKIEVAAVVSHKKESPGIEFAKVQGFDAYHFRLTDYKKDGKSREEYMADLAGNLKAKGVNFIVMAGWDLVLNNQFLAQFPDQVINIHPSLLPAFPGLDGPKQAMEYGVKHTGCTVHFVPDDGIDTGPIINQAVVEIKSLDSLEILEAKIHAQEERILCEAISLFADGKLAINGRIVRVVS